MKIKTGFTSPIGIVKCYDNSIVHVHITEMSLTKIVLQNHYALLEQHLGKPKYPFILTFQPNYLKMNAESRRFNNGMMNLWSTEMAVVVEKPLIRAFVNMYIRINPLIYEIKVCESLQDAFEHLMRDKELKN